MKRKVMVAMVVLAVISLAFAGCTPKVAQEVYNAMVAERDAALAERDAAQAEITSLEADLDTAQTEIETLETDLDTAQAGIENLEADLASARAETANVEAELADLRGQIASRVEEAWDIAAQCYTTLRESIEFNLEGQAPWLKLSDRPDSLDSANLHSITLVNEPPVYEAVCLIKLSGQQIFSMLSENAEMTTMIFRGGSQDYEMTVTRDENGDIIKMAMEAGESWCHLDWTVTEGLEYLTVQVNGKLKSFIWSNEPDEFENIYSAIISWLEAIDETGGLTAPADQPLMFLALGELSKPPRAAIVYSAWGEVIRRAAIDIFCGIPASCLS